MSGTRKVLVITGVVLLSSCVWITVDLPPHRAGANSTLPPAAYTGAQGEGTCVTCHTGSLDDGLGLALILNAPAAYTPGQTYGIAVAVAKSGKSRWGFELTCLKNSDNTAAGTFANPTPYTGTQSQGGRNYVSHTTLNPGYDGTFADSLDGGGWVFSWTAPAQGSGAVTFSAVSVAADNNQSANSGDDCYTSTAASTEGPATPLTPTTWGAIKRKFR